MANPPTPAENTAHLNREQRRAGQNGSGATIHDPGVLLRPDRLAERWDCSRQYIYDCMSRGLPSVKLGRARRIRVADADAWLESQGGGAR